MKVRTLIFALAGCLASTASLAAACPSAHAANDPLRCDLYKGSPLTLASGQSVSQRILLPLNTTIDDGHLPIYAVEFRTKLDAGSPAGRVHVKLWMSDDTGGHRVDLGATESTVQPGADKVSMAAGGWRFPQPAHLNVEVVRIDDEAAPLEIDGVHVIQSFDPDIEAAAR